MFNPSPWHSPIPFKNSTRAYALGEIGISGCICSKLLLEMLTLNLRFLLRGGFGLATLLSLASPFDSKILNQRSKWDTTAGYVVSPSTSPILMSCVDLTVRDLLLL